jgi:putative hydrolase of the HAD superfamily
MNAFIQKRFDVSYKEVDQIRSGYIEQYGTTQQGLSEEHGISPEEFLQYAHDIEVEKYLPRSFLFREALRKIPQPKYLFTNSPLQYARKILRHLQVEDLFEDYITIETLHYIGKPNRSAFEILLSRLPPDYQEIKFVDDEPKNIEMGQRFGLVGIPVNGREIPTHEYYDQFLIPLMKENL